VATTIEVGVYKEVGARARGGGVLIQGTARHICGGTKSQVLHVKVS